MGKVGSYGTTTLTGDEEITLKQGSATYRSAIDDLAVTATGGSEARTLADWMVIVAPQEAGVNVLAYIPVELWAGISAGTNTTDLKTYFDTALTAATGGELFLPAGRYLIDLSTDVNLTLPTGTTLRGVGSGAVIAVKIAAVSSVQRRLFRVFSGNLDTKFADLKIEVDSIDHTSSILEVWRTNGDGSGLIIENVDVDGGMVEAAGARNWNVYAVSTSADTGYSDVLVSGGKWENIQYGWVKTNVAVSTHRNITFRNVVFDQIFGETLSFNSPAGILSDVTVDGCQFGDNVTRSVSGTNPLHVAFASVDNFKVTDCTFKGEGLPVHIEEGCDTFLLDGLLMEVTHIDDDGIRILDNDIAGPDVSPRNGVIGSANVKGVGKATSTGVGLYFVHDGSGAAPSENVIVRGPVVIAGFDLGVAVSNETTTNDISGVMVVDCNIGIHANAGVEWVHDNVIIDCPIGLFATGGGQFGMHRFVDVADPFDEDSGTTSMGYPTSASGLVAGQIWANSGILTVA
jgi:hypothetical protein